MSESGMNGKPYPMTDDGLHSLLCHSANQTDAYIFETGHENIHEYTPTFTYHGFRFIQLTLFEVLANGTEIPLRDDTALPLSAFKPIIIAHRVNTDLKQVSSVQIHGLPGSTQDALTLQQVFNATLASHISQLCALKCVLMSITACLM